MSAYTQKQCKIVYDTCLQIQAEKWAAIPGVSVNYSFYEKSYNFTAEQIIEALIKLGVDYHAMPKQKKWWQFRRNDQDMRIAIALSKVETPEPEPKRKSIHLRATDKDTERVYS